ncbi:hypothetical protein Cni_G25868 [Canna indica]|uniref:Protodermal factor 1 n=1 Tax=Canna indica TaxID=4628 RepID=A0AAQ3KYJ6_9LILI|nr:hypothetical protein Cni_G25868 [Canna indica]
MEIMKKKERVLEFMCLMLTMLLYLEAVTPAFGRTYNTACTLPGPGDAEGGNGRAPPAHRSPTPSHGGGGGRGGYYAPPLVPNPEIGTTPPPPPSPLVPLVPPAPTYPVITTPPAAPMIPVDPGSVFPFTCDYWRTHPAAIWGLIGYWGTIGQLFGAPAAGAFGSDPSLQEALANTRRDGMGALYREGTASLLNSLASKSFVFSTQQVRDAFNAAVVSSDKAAAAQAREFKKANEGRLKH